MSSPSSPWAKFKVPLIAYLRAWNPPSLERYLETDIALDETDKQAGNSKHS